jgi:hypothetical protein
MAQVHHVAEVVADGGVRFQTPVTQHLSEVTIDLDRLVLFDDERSGEAAADLFVAANVRVVPESACVHGVELIGERLAGAIGGTGMCGTPSIAFGTRMPCQWMVVSSPNRLFTAMRSRFPCRTRISGPGTRPS